MVEIKIPNPNSQYEKTPAKRRVIKKYEDPETGEIFEFPRWIVWIEGTGEESRIMKWNEWVEEIELVTGETFEDLKKLYLKLAGEEYSGKHSKKDIVGAIIKLYFGEDWGGTIGQLLQNLKNRVVEKGRWGLGCPHDCGRFWEFKPTVDLTRFEPVDLVAMVGTDEQGNLTKGYLDWQEGKFLCDKCGGVVELV